MLFEDPLHEPAIDSLLMDLMSRWVVHDVPHRDAVLGLQDLNYLVAVLGHLDVDRLFLSSQGHEGAARKKKRRPSENGSHLVALEQYVLYPLKRPLIWTP